MSSSRPFLLSQKPDLRHEIADAYFWLVNGAMQPASANHYAVPLLFLFLLGWRGGAGTRFNHGQRNVHLLGGRRQQGHSGHRRIATTNVWRSRSGGFKRLGSAFFCSVPSAMCCTLLCSFLFGNLRLNYSIPYTLAPHLVHCWVA